MTTDHRAEADRGMYPEPESSGGNFPPIRTSNPVGTPAWTNPETVTVTLPRDVVERAVQSASRSNLRPMNFPREADLLDALADALDAASATQKSDQGERVAQGAGDAERPGGGRAQVLVDEDDVRGILAYCAAERSHPGAGVFERLAAVLDDGSQS